jgi:hypothetical protein
MEFAIRDFSEHVKQVYRTCLPVQGKRTCGIDFRYFESRRMYFSYCPAVMANMTFPVLGSVNLTQNQNMGQYGM